MTKATITLIISLLLLAAVAASTVETVQEHVYTDEEFEVEFRTSGPTNQHQVELEFMDQAQVVYVDTLGHGVPFKATVKFKAPPFAGEYEVRSDEGTAAISVEEPRFTLSDIKVEPSIISPRETTKLSYTVENVGDATLYNVKGDISIKLGAESDYEMYSGTEELFTSMGPGEKRTVVKEITARESASGQERIGVDVSYEFDGETHYASGDALLTVGGAPWIELLIILILVVLVGRVVLARYL